MAQPTPSDTSVSTATRLPGRDTTCAAKPPRRLTSNVPNSCSGTMKACCVSAAGSATSRRASGLSACTASTKRSRSNTTISMPSGRRRGGRTKARSTRPWSSKPGRASIAVSRALMWMPGWLARKRANWLCSTPEYAAEAT